jgi:hypothetical protein
MEEPVKVLACWPVSAGGRTVPGSTQGRCYRCDTAVWIAPSSATLPGPLTLMCLPCVAELDIGPHEGWTPEQARELLDAHLRGRAN